MWELHNTFFFIPMRTMSRAEYNRHTENRTEWMRGLGLWLEDKNPQGHYKDEKEEVSTVIKKMG